MLRFRLASVALLAALLMPQAAQAQAQTCGFVLGFALIRGLIGPSTVGDCLEEEHHNPANGDTLQRTTGGLLVWRKADNWTAFTDGHRSWVNGPFGLQDRLNGERFAWEADDRTVAAGRVRLGVYGWSPDDAAQRAAAREAGMTAAQVAVEWSSLEPTEVYNDRHRGQAGGFDASLAAPLDARVRAVSEAGLEPILLIAYPPDWAVTVPGTQGPLKPDRLGKYVDFATRVAQRYPAAKQLVLWPEPDHRQTLEAGCPENKLHQAWGDVPEQFAQMLKATYPAVKSARPDVQVIPGAIAYDNFGGPDRPPFNGGRCGGFSFTFLDRVLAAGGGDYFDVFAFNSYAIFAAGWDEVGQGRDVAAKASYIRGKFPALASKPMAVLEAGVWSDPSVPLPVRLPSGEIGTVVPNEAWQAAYPAKLFARGLSAGIGTMLWYGFRDGHGDVQRGLLDQTGRPKRSLVAFRHAASRLGDASYVGPLQPAAVQAGAPEGYVFRRPDGSRLTVLWAEGDQDARARVTLDLPAGARGEDAAGNPVPLGQTLDLTNSPIFVVG